MLRFYCHILGRNTRGGRGGGGGVESKIKNLKGLLRVFTPYFYWCVCHIKVHRLRLYTNYLLAISGYGISLTNICLCALMKDHKMRQIINDLYLLFLRIMKMASFFKEKIL